MLYDFTRRLGRILGFTSLWILLDHSATAFQPKGAPNKTPSSTYKTENFEIFDAHDAFNILNERVVEANVDIGIDLEKARDFASHYGKYSYEEVEHMRDDLHAHRILNDSPSDVLFLERIIEDELTSQLHSLKEHMPDPYLFRYPDYDYSEVPSYGLFGGNIPEADTDSDTQEAVSSTTTTTTTPTAPKELTRSSSLSNALAESKELLGEGFVESMVICIALAVVMFAPHQLV